MPDDHLPECRTRPEIPEQKIERIVASQDNIHLWMGIFSAAALGSLIPAYGSDSGQNLGKVSTVLMVIACVACSKMHGLLGEEIADACKKRPKRYMRAFERILQRTSVRGIQRELIEDLRCRMRKHLEKKRRRRRRGSQD